MKVLREGERTVRMDAATLRAYSPDQVRAAEEATGELLLNGTLMQRASSALAGVVAQVVRERDAHEIVVLVGPGNNGGDALFAAAKLANDGIRAQVVLTASKAHEGGRAAARDAGLDILQHPQGEHTECGGEHCDGPESLKAVARADVIIDGILGIGAQQRSDSPWGSVLREIPAGAYVIAVDCPTPEVRANRTVTFGALKTSLVFDGAAAGDIDVIDIGLESLGRPEAVRPGVLNLAMKWPIPGPHDHKYTRGVVGMATGSNPYPGAAVLGTVAAATAGAGMVRYLGPTRPSDAVLAAVPEAVHGAGRVQAWVIGSGIDGVSEREKGSDRYESALGVCDDDAALVIDAGALTWLDEIERPEGSVTVLTPHAGELAGVLKTLGVTDDGEEVTREVIEADPIRWAHAAANASGYVILLKGGVTVIAEPQTTDSAVPVLLENRAPNWLATAGTGDVLAGIVGVALAAGLEADYACVVAAYLHGRAAHLANPGGPIRALDVATNVGRAVTELVSIQQTFKQQMRDGDAVDPAVIVGE